MKNRSKTEQRSGIAEHVIVISYDAFSADNWEEAQALSNMAGLIAAGAAGNKLKSVCPSLTYVAHATMVTGVYPDRHGIAHNNPLQPFVNDKQQSWYWFRNAVKAPVIYDALKAAGMKTAGILWPVSGDSSIRYNMPEIVAINNENQALKVLRHGSPLYCIANALRFGHILKDKGQPYLDDFSTRCAVDTIKRKKPNLMLLHLIELDDAKHRYGTDAPGVSDAIARADKRIGDIVGAVKEAGIADKTVFIILGDHGQKNVRYRVYLNNFLEQNGLISRANGEKIWRAYFQSTGGAAYLHIKPGDEEAEQLCAALVRQLIAEGTYGIEALYDRAALDKYHIHPSAGYMVGARAGYEFADELGDINIEDLSEKGIARGNHGYFPDIDDYNCNIVISGAGIKSGVRLDHMELTDIAPTIAKILGVAFEDCDGRSPDGIFEGS